MLYKIIINNVFFGFLLNFFSGSMFPWTAVDSSEWIKLFMIGTALLVKRSIFQTIQTMVLGNETKIKVFCGII